MILLIDHYDSFSYNLYQLVGSLHRDISVVRSDGISPEEILERNPGLVILSPGPGRPEDAGVFLDAVRKLDGRIPILGVCLGHQAICRAYGGAVTYGRRRMHGKTSRIRTEEGSILFAGLGRELTVGRYHSLAADQETLPDCLAVTARAEDGEIMAVEHRSHPVYGIQFHPESILTPEGRRIVENLLIHLGMDREQEKRNTEKEEDR